MNLYRYINQKNSMLLKSLGKYKTKLQNSENARVNLIRYYIALTVIIFWVLLIKLWIDSLIANLISGGIFILGIKDDFFKWLIKDFANLCFAYNPSWNFIIIIGIFLQ